MRAYLLGGNCLGARKCCYPSPSLGKYLDSAAGARLSDDGNRCWQEEAVATDAIVNARPLLETRAHRPANRVTERIFFGAMAIFCASSY